MIKQDFRRSFAARHPLFKRDGSETGIRWKHSAYYLWWEFLRRHEGYRQTCLAGGKGAYSQLYADFGDVHGTDFKTWWSKDALGVRLFAEPRAPVGVVALSDDDMAEFVEQGRDSNTLVVAIPLDYQRRAIIKAFNKLLTQHFSRKRGEKRVAYSKARYPLARVPDVGALGVTLKCYDLRLKHPEKPLWWIAQEVGVSEVMTKAELEGRAGSVVSKKASMTAGVSRKLKQARSIIEGVGRGVFPAK
jgi:hypothetical protein